MYLPLARSVLWILVLTIKTTLVFRTWQALARFCKTALIAPDWRHLAFSPESKPMRLSLEWFFRTAMPKYSFLLSLQLSDFQQWKGCTSMVKDERQAVPVIGYQRAMLEPWSTAIEVLPSTKTVNLPRNHPSWPAPLTSGGRCWSTFHMLMAYIVLMLFQLVYLSPPSHHQQSYFFHSCPSIRQTVPVLSNVVEHVLETNKIGAEQNGQLITFVQRLLRKGSIS